jgi:hypothetical protein
MTEKDIFKKLCKSATSIIDYYNVETGSTEIGIPDVYFTTISGTHGWIELKIGEHDRYSDSIFFDYRPGQQNFLNDLKRKKIKAYLLFFYGDSYYLTNDFSDYFKPNLCLWKGSSFLDLDFLSILMSL